MPKNLLKNPAFLLICGAIAALIPTLNPTIRQSLIDVTVDATSPPRSMPLSEEWQVIKVSDGDTLTVRQTNGQQKKIRLCGIDAPESKQPLGKESKDNLQRLVDEVGGNVMVSELETDRYGRTVAEVFSSKNGQEKFLNEEQLTSGLAMVYPSYVKKCPNAVALGNAERIAKNKRLGVWGDSFTVPPWEFRKRQRQNNGN